MTRGKSRVALVAAATCVAATITSSATAAATTVAVWHMDEASGATRMIDSSGNNNTGTISGGVKVGSPGFSGRGYLFPGAGVVSVPSSSSLNPGTSPFAVSLRFKSATKPTSTVGDYDLIRKGLGTTSGGDWKMEVLQSGKLFCHFRGSSASVNLTGSTNVVTGSWHLLECRSTATGVLLRVDGKTQASTTRKPGTMSSSAGLTVGAKNSTADLTTGTLDEVVLKRG